METRNRNYWHVTGGNSIDIPDFPDGGKEMHLAVAQYKDPGDNRDVASNVVIRMSEHNFTLDELNADLEIFTRYYVERPQILGFPNKIGVSGVGPFVASIGTGLVAGIAGHSILGELGVLLGAAGIGPLGGGVEVAFAKVGEKLAKRKLPHKDQYIAGDKASQVLSVIQNHMIRTSVQRELYGALQQSGMEMDPERFLTDVYDQMPSRLLVKRMEEMEATKYPQRFSGELPEPIAISRMVKVAQALQAA